MSPRSLLPSSLLSLPLVARHAVGDLLSPPRDCDDDCWIKQGELQGFTIYYKIEDGAKLTCRIESPIPTSHLVPLLSVLNESELYETWIPSFHRPFKLGVTSSKQLATFSRGHQVIQVQCSVPYPISPREALFDVVAVDDIDANGFIIAKMTTITQEMANNNLPGNFQFPGVTASFERCDFEGAVLFRACPADHPNYASAQQKFQMHNGNDNDLILTTFAFSFDAKLRYIPQSLINFITREALGIIWNMLLKVAEQVRDGTRNEHCAIITQKKEFYKWVQDRCQFMLQKIQADNNHHPNPNCGNVEKDAPSTAATASCCRPEDLDKRKEEPWTMHDIFRLWG